jgi:VWFA-related protein
MRGRPERIRGPAIVAALVLALAAPAVGAGREEVKKREQPMRIGLHEEASVELTLVDVEVTDKRGRPIRGLTKDDFAVTLNWKSWPVYSVDDFCASEERPPAALVADLPEAPGGPPRSSEPPEGRPPQADPSRFVLYFDFSQLQGDGRDRAVTEARRWLRESLRPGDEAAIVTYGTDAGLNERCTFTSDRQKLLAAVDAAQNDPKSIEAWPSLRPMRMSECAANPHKCPVHAVDEYFHSRRSLKALRAFLETLAEIPGRKAVLYFNQNGILQPGTLYHQGEDKGGDNTGLLEDVASVATSSRAIVSPVFTGNELDPDTAFGTRAAVNFGANLADATGGRFNKGEIDLRALMETTARASACVYRLGLRPPTGPARNVYQLRVTARGRKVPWLYRIRFENEMDRWLKRARGVLRNPAGAQDLPVAAALLPVLSAGGRWKLSVQVALDADAIAYLPAAEGREAQWQVGALLHGEASDETWEMLGVSRIHRKAEVQSTAAVVHRRVIDDLRPGRYRLAAFVRDENTGLFGGAEAVIDLPPPGSGRIAGPVILRSSRKFFMAALPALAGKTTSSSSVSEVHEDAIPARAAPLTTGDTLVVDTWLCPGARSGPPPVRFVSRDGVPVFRFEPVAPQSAGRCLLFADTIDATRLAAGTYAYHFRWNGPGNTEPQEAEAKFEISPERR